MADEVGDLYQGARRVADSKGRGLRISLSMTGAPDLLEIPWEFLYDPGDAYFLSQSIYTPVVRTLDLKSPPASPQDHPSPAGAGARECPWRLRRARHRPRAGEPRARPRAADRERGCAARVARDGDARGARPADRVARRAPRDPLHRPRRVRRGGHEERRPDARGLERDAAQGDGRGARRPDARRAQPAARRAQFMRGGAHLARRSVLGRRFGPAALRAARGRGHAGRDHGRRRGRVLGSPVHRPGGGLPDRRGPGPGRGARSSPQATTSSSARRSSSCG